MVVFKGSGSPEPFFMHSTQHNLLGFYTLQVIFSTLFIIFIHDIQFVSSAERTCKYKPYGQQGNIHCIWNGFFKYFSKKTIV